MGARNPIIRRPLTADRPEFIQSSGRRQLGGGQEFQDDTPWHDLPDDLVVGPGPDTQGSPGVGGGFTPGMAQDLAMPAVSAPSPSLLNKFAADPWKQALLYSLQRKGRFQQTFGNVGTQAVLIRKAESRTYLIIQNTSVANTLIVAFGYAPQIIAGGATGLILLANGGNYEPSVIPQEDVWVVSAVAGTQWTLAVCTD
jgi:hypothetical protein